MSYTFLNSLLAEVSHDEAKMRERREYLFHLHLFRCFQLCPASFEHSVTFDACYTSFFDNQYKPFAE